MLNRDEIEVLLAAHNKAYQLLQWVADKALWKPDILSPQEAQGLEKPENMREWLKRRKNEIPPEFLPTELNAEFVNLFASFFATSFRVGHFEFEGHLVESRVKLGIADRQSSLSNANQCRYLALKHLWSAENLYLTDQETKVFSKKQALKDDLLLWTYVWELDRRARGKGKGAVVHQIWHSLALDVRKSLDVEKVWDARTRILEAVRDYIAQQYAL